MAPADHGPAVSPGAGEAYSASLVDQAAQAVSQYVPRSSPSGWSPQCRRQCDDPRAGHDAIVSAAMTWLTTRSPLTGPPTSRNPLRQTDQDRRAAPSKPTRDPSTSGSNSP